MTLRTCTLCNEPKPETPEFYYRNGDSYKTRCKSCIKLMRRHGPISPRPVQPRLTDKMVPAALALKAAGFTESRIADDLSVPQYAVKALFRVTA